MSETLVACILAFSFSDIQCVSDVAGGKRRHHQGPSSLNDWSKDVRTNVTVYTGLVDSDRFMLDLALALLRQGRKVTLAKHFECSIL